MRNLFQLAGLDLCTAAMLSVGQAASVLAQDTQPCPFAADIAASAVPGIPTQGFADPGTPNGFQVCEFGDFTVYHQSGDNVTSTPGVAGLAQNIVLALPANIVDLSAVLSPGQTIDPPGYHIAAVSGIGDAALWVEDSKFGVDALLVRRGSEVFALQVLHRPDAQASGTALARAILANTPPASPAGVPTGPRPAVIADCRPEVANAVADHLQRSDVSSINVIGGCHYVAIATTLDGGGFENAVTARAICDSATEVAYSSGILGITLTDLSGHERASGADGQPCSGFP